MDMAGRADTAAITTTGASVPGEGAGGMPLISQGGSGQGIPRKKGGITGSTFKLVGIITMLIDHTAAVVLIRELLGGSVRQSPDAFMTLLWENMLSGWGCLPCFQRFLLTWRSLPR